MSQVYYWETENSQGEGEFSSDEEALTKVLSSEGVEAVWVIYKENNTNDGTPFLVVYEKES